MKDDVTRLPDGEASLGLKPSMEERDVPHLGTSTIEPLAPCLRSRLERLDRAYRSSMDVARLHLQRTGMAGRAKGVGDRAPDFTLRDKDGATVTLSSLLLQGPVVLSFFRGEWCSFCRIEIDALIEALPLIMAEGAQLMMVSPQGPTEALIERSANFGGLTVLHDPLNGVGLNYGLLFRMPDILREALLAVGVDLSHIYGNDAWLLPIPATYVIRRDGTIAMAYTNPDFTNRLEPAEIIRCLQAG